MLTRRELLKVLGSAAAVSALPLSLAGLVGGCGDDAVPAPTRGKFFDEHQWATIDVATAQVLPTDDLPGARDARAVGYIDQLLAAFDETPPRIYAGGPFSGRAPFPDASGAASTRFPENAFVQFLPLSRVKEISWRVRIYGSAATPGGDFNDAVLGAGKGYRDLYLEGIAALDTTASAMFPGKTFATLEPSQQSPVYAAVAGVNAEFARTLLEHTIEGVFAAPEYGGNAGLVGWQLARWDGDSMPLGYAFFDEAAGVYRDRADKPTAARTPGDMPEDFDRRVVSLLEISALGSGGMRFF